MKHLLLVCCNAEILETLCRIFSKQEEYEITPVSKIEEIYLSLRRSRFDGVLLGSGLSADEEKDIRFWIKENTPETRLIFHYGGGSGLLFCELKTAFKESL